MPILRMPDGKQVRFPDDMPKDKIKGIISKKYPDAFKPEPSISETIADVGVSAGSGITNAAVGFGELPADLASGGRWLADKAGIPQDIINKGASITKALPGIGGALTASQLLKKEMANPTTAVGRGLKAYREYNPETTAGDYAQTTGEFAAGALGPKTGLLTRAAKYVAAPALASETAGQLTEGTELEPWARGVGSLVGLGGAAKALNPLAESRAVGKLTQSSEFKRKANEAYDILDTNNITIKNSKMADIWDGLDKHLARGNFRPGVDKQAASVLNEIQRDVLRGYHGKPPLRFRDVEGITAHLGQRAKDATGGDRRVLYMAKHFLDDAFQKIDDTGTNLQNGFTVVRPDRIKRVQNAIKDARSNWFSMSKADALDEMVRLGEITGHTAYTRGGTQLGTQREFLKFIKKPHNKQQKFSEDELKAFERVATGGKAGRALRSFGKLASSGSAAFHTGINASILATLMGLPLGPAAPVVGAVAGLGVPTVARMARNASNRSTAKSIADAQALIRSGSKLKRPYNSILGKLSILNAVSNE